MADGEVLYGAVTLDATKSAGSLATDSTGKIISGSAGALPVGGTNAIQTYATSSTFGGNNATATLDPSTGYMTNISSLVLGNSIYQPNTVGMGSGAIQYGSGTYGAVGNTVQMQVSTYKIQWNGQRLYSGYTGLSATVTDNNSGAGTHYKINWTWTAQAGADGYRIIIMGSVAGQPNYSTWYWVETTTNSYLDDGTGTNSTYIYGAPQRGSVNQILRQGTDGVHLIDADLTQWQDSTGAVMGGFTWDGQLYSAYNNFRVDAGGNINAAGLALAPGAPLSIGILFGTSGTYPNQYVQIDDYTSLEQISWSLFNDGHASMANNNIFWDTFGNLTSLSLNMSADVYGDIEQMIGTTDGTGAPGFGVLLQGQGGQNVIIEQDWIDMPTDTFSGIGSGGYGTNPWIAYTYSNGQWFADALAGDISYRNTGGRLVFGPSGYYSAFGIIGGNSAYGGGITPGTYGYQEVAVLNKTPMNFYAASGTGTPVARINTDGSGASSFGSITAAGLIYPQQHATSGAPSYVKGAIYFDTTLNKLRVGGAAAWETITSV